MAQAITQAQAFTRVEYPLDDGAQLKTYTVAAPVAGADWSVVVPANKIWVVESISATLTTTATVANRQPNLEVFDPAANRVLSIPPQLSLTAGVAFVVTWLRNHFASSQTTPSSRVNMALADVLLPPGFTIGPSTTSIQAGDAWTGIVLYVSEQPYTY